jgi:hypothetical protein
MVEQCEYGAIERGGMHVIDHETAHDNGNEYPSHARKEPDAKQQRHKDEEQQEADHDQ